MTGKLRNKILFLFLLLIFAILAGALIGSVNIPFSELLLEGNRPILNLRLLRIFLAAVAGAGLSVSGIALQAILKNSLAEPYLLGTSSGAGLGAVIAVILGVSGIYLPLAAFIGAVLSIVLVYNLAKQNNKILPQSLILSGVIVSVAVSAIIVFLISASSNEALHGITWWLWGSLQVYDWTLLIIICTVVMLGVAAVYIFSQDLNAISLGEEEAMHLGIDIEAVKKILILIVSLITAGLVSVCGIIGFVGLIVPHMMRLLIGPNHKTLIPVSCLAAAIFMITCDILSRTIFPPLEIPIGVITAFLGAPVFIILLKVKQGIK
ncbi:MAG: iron ABC transporter permease [Candidatus Omnitrophica bacterium]|nr:iron ABC transporter permease [Candidatus Omnitrophota bacterium]MDD5591749.1 iron ABC transporter permease [Candidatus Omnitrophota bacterium]